MKEVVRHRWAESYEVSFNEDDGKVKIPPSQNLKKISIFGELNGKNVQKLKERNFEVDSKWKGTKSCSECDENV